MHDMSKGLERWHRRELADPFQQSARYYIFKPRALERGSIVLFADLQNTFLRV